VDLRIHDLEDQLRRHRPVDDLEELALARLAALLAGASDPFARATLPAHVTSSAVVLDPRRRLLLLHLHRRIGRWLQPGGHIEPGEHPADAAVRETQEETGVAVRHDPAGPVVLHVDEHPGPDGHIHLDLRYLLLADGEAPLLGDGEATGHGPGATLRWVDPVEVHTIADPSLARAVVALGRRLTDLV
jgi:8-oxo-dGTP pyrophosphatase MutT (NUDIX family)